MKELTCIICPRGCHLLIDESLNVSGNFCPRGQKYAVSELTNPTRTITSTMRLVGSSETRVPVKTNKPISKSLMFEIMEIINKTYVKAPVHIGDILIKNIINSGADIVATKNIK